MNQLFLETSIKACKTIATKGRVADYIPSISTAPKDALGICIAGEDGTILEAGDSKQKFTIQSISKPFTLMLAILDRGVDEVFRFVGMESTGDPFNSVFKLETSKMKKPFNAMINAGAIEVASLIHGTDANDRFLRVLDFMRTIAENPNLTLNQEIYENEKTTGDRNWSLAYFLRGEKLLATTPEEALDCYFRQCSVEVSAVDLAKMGLFLARGGKLSDKTQFVPEDVARLVRSQIAFCGLYDGSGEFAVQVGIPSKSGVGGGILSAVPGRMGIGVYGPALDEKGNSIGGIALLQKLSRKEGLSIY